MTCGCDLRRRRPARLLPLRGPHGRRRGLRRHLPGRGARAGRGHRTDLQVLHRALRRCPAAHAARHGAATARSQGARLRRMGSDELVARDDPHRLRQIPGPQRSAGRHRRLRHREDAQAERRHLRTGALPLWSYGFALRVLRRHREERGRRERGRHPRPTVRERTRSPRGARRAGRAPLIRFQSAILAGQYGQPRSVSVTGQPRSVGVALESGVERVVPTLHRDELVMSAAFDDAAGFDDHDAVRVADRRQTMRDDERGAPLHEPVHAMLDERLGAGVDRRGRLIEDQRRRIGDGGTRDGEQLPLALTQGGAVRCQLRVVAVGQLLDEGIRIGEARRGPHLLIGGVETPEADVVHDRTGEQVRVLQHHAQRPAQIALAHIADIDAVIGDRTGIDVVEAGDEVGDRRLAGAGGSDERDLLPGLGEHRHVVKHFLALHIAEVHVIETDVAAHRRDTAVGRILPTPVVGALARLDQSSVRVVRDVDERDPAVILLDALVEQIEDALAARQRHDDGVELLRDLRDRHREAFDERQEAHERAQRETGGAGHRERAADQRADHVADVAELVVDGAQIAGELVGLVGGVIQTVVDLTEVVFGGLLVREHLDDLLPGHHLLDEAVELADGPLLLREVRAGAAGQHLGQEHHDRGDDEHHTGQRHAQVDHRGQDHDDLEHRGEDLRDGLGDHLAQRVDVVGVQAHHVAARVRVEIAERQLLHVPEHAVAQPTHESLGDECHEDGLDARGHDADRVEAGEREDGAEQRAEVAFRRLRMDERHDVVVDESLDEQIAAHVGEHGDEDARHDDGVLHAVSGEQVTHETCERAPRMAHLQVVLRRRGVLRRIAPWSRHHFTSGSFVFAAASSKSPPPLVCSSTMLA
ncbi:HAD-superfamily hydrolase [Bifidobacterium callitrichos DSM 23973]|uniref:HAD-superfamily hydrolase n=1 Tax=Bifidobacterium callitrichos DSM 23973 TaxID=1437609 RepID=A0A087ACY2_9BIFI|nr:HAD-superfamily hydrolase [Bifidobacterium callitrichos DSM 23973]